LYLLFGPKINLSRISPAKCSQSIPNLIYVDISRGDNVQGILGAVGQFWAKWGLGQILRSQSFFVVIQRTFRQLRNGRFSPNLVTKRSSVSRRGIQKDISENFHFRGHLPPKFEIKTRSNRHLTQSKLQVTGCTAERYCLFHVVVQWPGSFEKLVNFSLPCMVMELRGVKVAQFSDFDLFCLYKTPKTYLPVTSLQPRGYITE